MASGVAVWLGVAASPEAAAPVSVLGLAGAALVAAAVFRTVLLGPALATLAGAYALLLAIDEPPLDARAAGVGAALLVVGELTGWAHELSGPAVDEPGGAWRRPVWVAGAAAGALALGWTLLAVVDLTRLRGLAVEAVGALAALATLVLVLRTAAQRQAVD